MPEHLGESKRGRACQGDDSGRRLRRTHRVEHGVGDLHDAHAEPSQAVASRRGASVVVGERTCAESRTRQGQPCRARLVDEVEALEEHPLASAGVGARHASHLRDERVLAARDDFHPR